MAERGSLKIGTKETVLRYNLRSYLYFDSLDGFYHDISHVATITHQVHSYFMICRHCSCGILRLLPRLLLLKLLLKQEYA